MPYGYESGIADFYGTLAQVSFTVFGLWLVVVQVRRGEWIDDRHRRWGAQVVALHFALPGVMSLLNLANPDSALLWRISFAAFAALGCVGMVLLGRPTHGGLPGLVHLGAVGIYGAVAVVAVFADVVAAVLGVSALQVEAVLLSLLVFLGLNLAFSLLFARGATAGRSDRRSP